MPLCNFVNLYYITRHHTPEDSVPHNRCEKLKYRIIVNILKIIIIFTARPSCQTVLQNVSIFDKSMVAEIFFTNAPY
jgi:hypothetical protein